MIRPQKPRRNLEQDKARRALARLPTGVDLLTAARAIQASLGYLPPIARLELASRFELTPERLFTRLREGGDLLYEPSGLHRVRICTGRTCARLGGAKLARTARETLGLEFYRTSPDGAVRLDPFKCFGRCAMAPNVEIDERRFGAMQDETLRLLLALLRK